MMGLRRRSAPMATLRSTSARDRRELAGLGEVTSRMRIARTRIRLRDSRKRKPSAQHELMSYLAFVARTNCGGGLFQRFGKHAPIASGQRDSTQRRQCWSDVGRRDASEIFTVLDASAHQQNRNVLIIIVGRPVTGAIGALFVRRSAC